MSIMYNTNNIKALPQTINNTSQNSLINVKRGDKKGKDKYKYRRETAQSNRRVLQTELQCRKVSSNRECNEEILRR